MIQYGQYVVDRAKKPKRCPLDHIDLTSYLDTAIITIDGDPSKVEHPSKMRVTHPNFAPKKFIENIIEKQLAANGAGRWIKSCTFPNHECLWKEISKFARQNFKDPNGKPIRDSYQTTYENGMKTLSKTPTSHHQQQPF